MIRVATDGAKILVHAINPIVHDFTSSNVMQQKPELLGCVYETFLRCTVLFPFCKVNTMCPQFFVFSPHPF